MLTKSEKELSFLENSNIKKFINYSRKISFIFKRIFKNPKESYALVIDGGTLGLIFSNNLVDRFREICLKCEAVLCCRMSPAQKANVIFKE